MTRLPHLTFANITSSLALFIALGGTSYAVTKLPRDSVGSEQVRDRSLRAADLAPGAIPAGLRGPRGSEGPPGPKGDRGETGPEGPAATATAESWKPLPFASGWGSYGEVWQPAEYRRTSTGRVELRGLATKSAGTPGRGDIIAQLPEGHRPAAGIILGVPGGQSDGFAAVSISAAGTVQWLMGPTGERDYLSLEQITFAAR